MAAILSFCIWDLVYCLVVVAVSLLLVNFFWLSLVVFAYFHYRQIVSAFKIWGQLRKEAHLIALVNHHHNQHVCGKTKRPQAARAPPTRRMPSKDDYRSSSFYKANNNSPAGRTDQKQCSNVRTTNAGEKAAAKSEITRPLDKIQCHGHKPELEMSTTYLTVACTAKCLLKYHQNCWKNLIESQVMCLKLWFIVFSLITLCRRGYKKTFMTKIVSHAALISIAFRPKNSVYLASYLQPQIHHKRQIKRRQEPKRSCCQQDY